MRSGISGLPSIWVFPNAVNPDATLRNTPNYCGLEQSWEVKTTVVKVEMCNISYGPSQGSEKIWVEPKLNFYFAI